MALQGRTHVKETFMAASPDQVTYLYRCTEDKLEQHLASIAEAGDIVEHVIFKGGRDYVLVCRRGQERPVTVALVAESIDAVADAIHERFRVAEGHS
jgi:hypothetical protein